MKKRVVKHVPAEVRAEAQVTRVVPRPVPEASAIEPAERKPRESRAPKMGSLTPENRRRIAQLYEEEYAGQQIPLRDVHSQIAAKLWVKRQVVADVIKDLSRTMVVLTPELKERAIEMYKRFVETGHRPDGGRRRAISVALGVPYKQVMKLIREWSMAQYEQSPTPTPSRQQLFEIEKTYWQEVKNERYSLTELPARIAEQLGYVTRWQVLRWLDVLHDDEGTFANVPDPPPEVRQQIVDHYVEYLASAAPPDHGLHYTIAEKIPRVSPRQVHKILQSLRHKMRAEYPLV